MLFHEEIRRLIRSYRKGAICEIARISVQTLENVLSGDRQPRADTVRRLGSAFGVDVGGLFDDEKSWPPIRTRPVTDLMDEPAQAAASGAVAAA
ncbi:MAG: helix-turn-helix transcriptional regulator [Planctomycetota bacterium]|nr:helix-turn-helix transcriptional regulator [Planctomycetota bacterium]